MKVQYDPQTDTLTITLRDARIQESDEVRPGVIADFGYDGGIVRFELLNASKIVDQTLETQFEPMVVREKPPEGYIAPGG